MKSVRILLAVVAFAVLSYSGGLKEAAATDSAEGATVYIISPANGEVVSKMFTVKFGLSGMGVAPAGTDKKNTGHHHLMIDGKKLPMMTMAMDKKVVKHFGGGQTETMLMLSPGKHTLRLILGDKAHTPHNPPVVSEEITITVK